MLQLGEEKLAAEDIGTSMMTHDVGQLARHMSTKHKEFLELNGVGHKKELPAPKIQ